MKKFHLKYDFLGADREFETSDLHEFSQKLEEVEDSDFIINSSIVIYTTEGYVKSSPDVPIEKLEQLYKDYGMFHESMEDFMNRMEADNGTYWIAKFVKA